MGPADRGGRRMAVGDEPCELRRSIITRSSTCVPPRRPKPALPQNEAPAARTPCLASPGAGPEDHRRAGRRRHGAPVRRQHTVGHGAMHATALCTEHQKSGASNTPPPLAAATVTSIQACRDARCAGTPFLSGARNAHCMLPHRQAQCASILHLSISQHISLRRLKAGRWSCCRPFCHCR
jgi:hypothetical protein